jgi:hypothetical protein
MDPKEFIKYIQLSKDDLLEIRIKSLGWVMESYNDGKIRKRTIVNLIRKDQLDDILEYLVEKERYEECVLVKKVMDEFFK